MPIKPFDLNLTERDRGSEGGEGERWTYFPQITKTHKQLKNKSHFDKLPYIC
jgi:hypothetical protein